MKKSNDLGCHLMMIVYIYLLFTQLFAAYFFWEYLQENSFLESIIFGSFVAEFKGLLFPFFI
tara:strand:+ start:1625 stop:1810 length:186 start_codon:yes stop_codon:yes gene_type:complete